MPGQVASHSIVVLVENNKTVLTCLLLHVCCSHVTGAVSTIFAPPPFMSTNDLIKGDYAGSFSTHHTHGHFIASLNCGIIVRLSPLWEHEGMKIVAEGLDSI